MTRKRESLEGNARGAPSLTALSPVLDGVEPELLEPPSTNGVDVLPALALNGRALARGDGEGGNTLQTYLREIRRAPLLSPEEEFDTATRARAGDFAARQSMIERNLRLVVSIA